MRSRTTRAGRWRSIASSGRSVGRRHDGEPVTFEIGPDEPDDLGVVIDDEDRPIGDGGGLHREHRNRRR